MADITLKIVWYKLGETYTELCGKYEHFLDWYEEFSWSRVDFLDMLFLGWLFAAFVVVGAINLYLRFFGHPKQSSQSICGSGISPRDGETAQWLNTYFSWLHKHYLNTPEFVEAWIRALNEQTRKHSGEYEIKVDRVQEGSPLPRISHIATESSTQECICLKVGVEAQDAVLLVSAIQHSATNVRVTNCDVAILKLTGQLKVQWQVNREEIQVNVCFATAPQLNLQVRPKQIDSQVNLKTVEDVVQNALCSSVTSLALPTKGGYPHYIGGVKPGSLLLDRAQRQSAQSGTTAAVEVANEPLIKTETIQTSHSAKIEPIKSDFAKYESLKRDQISHDGVHATFGSNWSSAHWGGAYSRQISDPSGYAQTPARRNEHRIVQERTLSPSGQSYSTTRRPVETPFGVRSTKAPLDKGGLLRGNEKPKITRPASMPFKQQSGSVTSSLPKSQEVVQLQASPKRLSSPTTNESVKPESTRKVSNQSQKKVSSFQTNSNVSPTNDKSKGKSTRSLSASFVQDLPDCFTKRVDHPLSEKEPSIRPHAVGKHDEKAIAIQKAPEQPQSAPTSESLSKPEKANVKKADTLPMKTKKTNVATRSKSLSLKNDAYKNDSSTTLISSQENINTSDDSLLRKKKKSKKLLPSQDQNISSRPVSEIILNVSSPETFDLPEKKLKKSKRAKSVSEVSTENKISSNDNLENELTSVSLRENLHILDISEKVEKPSKRSHKVKKKSHSKRPSSDDFKSGESDMKSLPIPSDATEKIEQASVPTTKPLDQHIVKPSETPKQPHSLPNITLDQPSFSPSENLEQPSVSSNSINPPTNTLDQHSFSLSKTSEQPSVSSNSINPPTKSLDQPIFSPSENPEQPSVSSNSINPPTKSLDQLIFSPSENSEQPSVSSNSTNPPTSSLDQPSFSPSENSEQPSVSSNFINPPTSSLDQPSFSPSENSERPSVSSNFINPPTNALDQPSFSPSENSEQPSFSSNFINPPTNALDQPSFCLSEYSEHPSFSSNSVNSTLDCLIPPHMALSDFDTSREIIESNLPKKREKKPRRKKKLKSTSRDFQVSQFMTSADIDCPSPQFDKRNISATSPTGSLQNRRLLVKVIKANGLGDKDFACTGPYCLVHLDEPRQKNTTSVVKNTVNPFWDEHFIFDLVDESAEVKFEVFDRDKPAGIDFLGRAVISMGELKRMPSSRQIIPLTGKPGATTTSGSITVEFLFMEIESQLQGTAAAKQHQTETAESLSPKRRIETNRTVMPGGTVVTTKTTVTERPKDHRLDLSSGNPSRVEKSETSSNYTSDYSPYASGRNSLGAHEAGLTASQELTNGTTDSLTDHVLKNLSREREKRETEKMSRTSRTSSKASVTTLTITGVQQRTPDERSLNESHMSSPGEQKELPTTDDDHSTPATDPKLEIRFVPKTEVKKSKSFADTLKKKFQRKPKSNRSQSVDRASSMKERSLLRPPEANNRHSESDFDSDVPEAGLQKNRNRSRSFSSSLKRLFKGKKKDKDSGLSVSRESSVSRQSTRSATGALMVGREGSAAAPSSSQAGPYGEDFPYSTSVPVRSSPLYDQYNTH